MTAWRDSLGGARGRVAPGVGSSLRWWRQSLLAWLPVRWQWAMGWSRSRLLLQRAGDVLRLQRQTNMLQASLQAFAKVAGLSLVNYI